MKCALLPFPPWENIPPPPFFLVAFFASLKELEEEGEEGNIINFASGLPPPRSSYVLHGIEQRFFCTHKKEELGFPFQENIINVLRIASLRLSVSRVENCLTLMGPTWGV